MAIELPPWKPLQGLMRQSGNSIEKNAYRGLQSLGGLIVDTVRAWRCCAQVQNKTHCVVI